MTLLPRDIWPHLEAFRWVTTQGGGTVVSGGGGWGAAESPAVCRAAPNRCAYRAEVAIPPEGLSSPPWFSPRPQWAPSTGTSSVPLPLSFFLPRSVQSLQTDLSHDSQIGISHSLQPISSASKTHLSHCCSHPHSQHRPSLPCSPVGQLSPRHSLPLSSAYILQPEPPV